MERHAEKEKHQAAAAAAGTIPHLGQIVCRSYRPSTDQTDTSTDMSSADRSSKDISSTDRPSTGRPCTYRSSTQTIQIDLQIDHLDHNLPLWEVVQDLYSG